VRIDPKGFYQQRPNGNGGWINGIAGVRLVPFRLPHVAKAVAEGKVILIVEGEKDVLTAENIGVAATCNPMGAKKWRPEFAPHFNGADIVLVPDKDPDGYAHIEQVGASLKPAAKRVRQLILPANSKDLSEWLDSGGTREKLDALIAQAPDWMPHDDVRDAGTGGTGNGNSLGAGGRSTADAANPAKPVIQIEPGKLPQMATRAEHHLIAANVPFYKRGSMLVRPIILEVPASDGRKTKTPALESVTETYMCDRLDQVIGWDRYRPRERKWFPADAPPQVARRILGRVGEWKFPAIAGVISTPTLRPDGTVLCAPGYDDATGFLLVDPPALPPIPEEPTRTDAETALALLNELLREFPFVDEASRSVALSALMTPIVRGAFPVAPMHAGRKPTPGTGTSYLFDIAAAIAIGDVCPAIAAGRDEAETEKRVGAAALAGHPIISLDNVNGELGGDFLCQLIERPYLLVRILGKSEMVRIPNRATIFANGNNLRLVGDMTRRVILFGLDAKLERPDLREFKSDPVERVLANRGKYIAAILTIARAYIAAGRSGKLKPLASFKGWSDTVRSPLVWLGCADPVDTIVAVRAEDPDLRALAAMLTAWKAGYGAGLENAHTAKEAIESGPADLLSAIVNISPRGKPDPKSLGTWLRNHKDRIVNRLCFKQWERSGRADDWYVE
jgi:hypothetical protein